MTVLRWSLADANLLSCAFHLRSAAQSVRSGESSDECSPSGAETQRLWRLLRQQLAVEDIGYGQYVSNAPRVSAV